MFYLHKYYTCEFVSFVKSVQYLWDLVNNSLVSNIGHLLDINLYLKIVFNSFVLLGIISIDDAAQYLTLNTSYA